jgi:mono/diheme cytochrome c family protein
MWLHSLPECLRRIFLAGLIGVAGVLPAGGVIADSATGTSGAAVERWYSRDHVERGAALYAEHCAACHGQNAEGTKNWRQRNADGKFPPPPVDGTGHAWHHPINILGAQIKFGAPGGQGSMPGFADKLSDDQIIDVIAWFQDRWPDEVYASWAKTQSNAR